MEAVAKNVHPGLRYSGIVYESDRPEIRYEMPDGGVDVQNKIVHWIFPDGRSVACTASQLADKKFDEIVDPNARDAYSAMGLSGTS